MIETQSGCIGCKALDCVCVKPNPIHAYIEAVEKRVSKATPGKSWIDMCQSDGCWVKLFDQTYTIHLVARKGEWKQFERDAELLVHAPEDLARLTAALRVAVSDLKQIEDADVTTNSVVNLADSLRRVAREAIQAIERVFEGVK